MKLDAISAKQVPGSHTAPYVIGDNDDLGDGPAHFLHVNPEIGSAQYPFGGKCHSISRVYSPGTFNRILGVAGFIGRFDSV